MNDELDHSLRGLAQPPLDPAARERIVSAARAAFDAAEPSRIDRIIAKFERGYARCEPFLAFVVGAIHLSWAVSAL